LRSGIGSDLVYIAAIMGNMGLATVNRVVQVAIEGRKDRSLQGGETKHGTNGNIARSAVREGRNVKRQNAVEAKKKRRTNITVSVPIVAAPEGKTAEIWL